MVKRLSMAKYAVRGECGKVQWALSELYKRSFFDGTARTRNQETSADEARRAVHAARHAAKEYNRVELLLGR